MMKSKIMVLLVLLMLAISLSACAGRTNVDEPNSLPSVAPTPSERPDPYHLELTFSNKYREGEPLYEASVKFAEDVAEKTDGHIVINYESNCFYDCYEKSVLRACDGDNWIGLEKPSEISSATEIPDILAVTGPMLCRSYEEYLQLMQSELFEGIEQQLSSNNVHLLCSDLISSFNQIFTHSQFSDINQLYFSTILSRTLDIETLPLKMLGFVPYPANFDRGVSIFYTEKITGLDSNYAQVHSSQLAFDRIYCVIETNHSFDIDWLFMPEDLYQSIPEKYRVQLDTCAADFSTSFHQSRSESDEAVIRALEDKGALFVSVDPELLAESARPIYEMLETEYGCSEDIYDSILDCIRQYRLDNQPTK